MTGSKIIAAPHNFTIIGECLQQLHQIGSAWNHLDATLFVSIQNNFPGPHNH